jgi:genome maintenance exonuclease 1
MSTFRFKHIETDLPELTTKTIDRKRYYITPEGKEYPSITTVLSNRGKEGLFEWRNRVGHEVANYISGKAAKRGTAVHHMCEEYLNNVSFIEPDWWIEKQKNFLPFCLFNQLRNGVLQRINNIHAQECGLYSDKYGVAGRVDCIAEYNRVLSIIDFKTSTSERNDEYNENYYIQTAAYAEMYEERTGIPTDQIIILVVTEDGTVQEFIKSKQEYLPLLEEAINEFNVS